MYKHNTEPKFIIKMEFCQNGDLEMWIKNWNINIESLTSQSQKDQSKITFEKLIDLQKEYEKEILKYFKQIAQGVNYLHQRRILHRDIKPKNIFLTQDFELVKLGDLGSSKIINDTFLQSMKGTLSYIAPEVINRESGYSFPSDVWSMGMVLFQMILKKEESDCVVQNFRANVSKVNLKELLNSFCKNTKLIYLCCQCLQIQPKNRPTVEKILQVMKLEESDQLFKDDLFSKYLVFPQKIKNLFF
jgi:serine/threonine protein kinase